MTACRPVTRWARFSFVETWTVSDAAPQGGGGEFRIGRGREEVSAQREKDLGLPGMHGADGLDRVVAELLAADRSQTPPGACRGTPSSAAPRCPSSDRLARCYARAPGRRLPPACRWPPRNKSRLTISWMVATALRCCVRPIAQQAMIRSDCISNAAASWIWSREMPLCSMIVLPWHAAGDRQPGHRTRWSARG